MTLRPISKARLMSPETAEILAVTKEGYNYYQTLIETSLKYIFNVLTNKIYTDQNVVNTVLCDFIFLANVMSF